MIGLGWKEILEHQRQRYPDWMTEMTKELLATALAGECGEVCGVVTHLEGGGTNLEEYNKEMVLHQCVDTYIQMVLLLARYGFGPDQFVTEFDATMVELYRRMKESQND